MQKPASHEGLKLWVLFSVFGIALTAGIVKVSGLDCQASKTQFSLSRR